ncbi:hypothetical protein DICVIV_02165 [Dictyocaulus viviparus]|uniref:Uncharacterized protein n=1 Tax=Dictyocaulus viviparus TaxID=29172 RepID=A0A0D8Y6L2_DICVI|nr:hypothetical protein DICVIV_02165 [Dictyocaulus viviparus]
MMYMKPFRFVKNALTNTKYYPTYGAYGVSAFLMALYICEWKTVGQYIPLWNKRYTAD